MSGCEKLIIEQPSPEQPTSARESVFPMYVYLGSDTSYFRKTTFSLRGAEAYLPFCGVSPEYEVPNWGVEVYQIGGASQATITGSFPNMTFSDLTFGDYTFVGHAFMYGYRRCDETFLDDHAYDTLRVRILKNRKKN